MAFTLQDAEARGWRVVHRQETRTDDLGDGLFRVIPGYVRAECHRNGSLLNEIGDGEDPDKSLLDRIEWYEFSRTGTAAPVDADRVEAEEPTAPRAGVDSASVRNDVDIPAEPSVEDGAVEA